MLWRKTEQINIFAKKHCWYFCFVLCCSSEWLTATNASIWSVFDITWRRRVNLFIKIGINVERIFAIWTLKIIFYWLSQTYTVGKVWLYGWSWIIFDQLTVKIDISSFRSWNIYRSSYWLSVGLYNDNITFIIQYALHWLVLSLICFSSAR